MNRAHSKPDQRSWPLPLVTAFLTLMLLTACGQRGPLYLPDDDSRGKVETAEQKAAEEIRKNKDNDPLTTGSGGGDGSG